MSADIVEVPIIDREGRCIFNRGDRYLVPIYQRAFAWGTGDSVRPNEILQLMDDVSTCEGGTYRLGSLVVARQGERTFEVIDGQQRLTALFLILASFDVDVSKEGLSYACRPSAETALIGIAKKTFTSDDGVSAADPASGIVSGMMAIKQKIQAQENPDAYKAELLAKFKSVVLCRTVVPEKTDLNRYFEIMNTRGEQLEQQDIVKARLMRSLTFDSEKSAFAMIWDACSDMDGYCQMHFLDTDVRKGVFGEDWTTLQDRSEGSSILAVCGGGCSEADDKGATPTKICFKELVLTNPEEKVKSDDSEQYSRFESIIDFRHLLLHALRVFTSRTKAGVSLDDGRLIESFEIAEREWESDSGDFARAFIWHLLKCRYMFDRYVIKRVYDSDGKSCWCLQEVVANENGGPSYRNTIFSDEYEVQDILMIEACLRVSYLDPKRMHWVTKILGYLISCKNGQVNGADLKNQLLGVAQKEVRDFLKISNYACMGVSTPHIILHYLDYILWQKQDDVVKKIVQKDFDEDFAKNFAKGFSFEYRSSIEHWYPQTPPNGVPFPSDCNRFGNLCILRGDINSKFSNLMPESKELNHEQYLQLEHQSLKLRIMAELTRQRRMANQTWDQDTCAEHEKWALDLLKEDIGFSIVDQDGSVTNAADSSARKAEEEG